MRGQCVMAGCERKALRNSDRCMGCLKGDWAGVLGQPIVISDFTPSLDYSITLQEGGHVYINGGDVHIMRDVIVDGQSFRALKQELEAQRNRVALLQAQVDELQRMLPSTPPPQPAQRSRRRRGRRYLFPPFGYPRMEGEG